MTKKRLNQAVSEILGVTLLLGISISLFSCVQLIVYTYPFEPSPPSVDLFGSINHGYILIEHHGGESISLDCKIKIIIGELDQISFIANDYLKSSSSDGDDFWEIGEIVAYDPDIDLSGVRVVIIVVDVDTNSIVMSGVIQGGTY